MTTHLVLDGQSEKLKSAYPMDELLCLVVQLAGMRLIDTPGHSNPWVIDYHPDSIPRSQWGVTAVALIETSHVTIHTFTESGRFYFDLVSCKSFDGDLVEAFLVKELEATVQKGYSLQRYIGP